MSRLSSATLATLPADVARPRYDRGAVRCGVVHLGIGAFHRAHQAVVFEQALNAGDLRWGIVAASLRCWCAMAWPIGRRWSARCSR